MLCVRHVQRCPPLRQIDKAKQWDFRAKRFACFFLCWNFLTCHNCFVLIVSRSIVNERETLIYSQVRSRRELIYSHSIMRLHQEGIGPVHRWHSTKSQSFRCPHAELYIENFMISIRVCTHWALSPNKSQ